MKLLLAVALLFSGCASLPTLESFRNWSSQEVGNDQFQINIGDVKEDRYHEAFVYAATLTRQRGYDAFMILYENGNDPSGTHFEWGQSYGGGPGMMIFAPGKYFTIRCRHGRASRNETWFDAKRTQRRKIEPLKKASPQARTPASPPTPNGTP